MESSEFHFPPMGFSPNQREKYFISADMGNCSLSTHSLLTVEEKNHFFSPLLILFEKIF